MPAFRSCSTVTLASLFALAGACGDNNHAAPDARAGADAMVDARVDAPIDAPIDAMIDAPIDAMVGSSGPLNLRFNAFVGASLHVGSAWYFGGNFTRIYTKPAPKLVPLTAAGAVVTTCDLGAGFDAAVSAIATAGTSIYVGGAFTTYKGAPANHLAKLDATTCALDAAFSPAAGNGFDAAVNGLAVAGTSLFVVGDFTAYRGVADAADHLAKLDLTTGAIDTTFSPPGAGNNGFDQAANAVVVAGTAVYVGGIFTAYRGGAANVSRIAKLDTTSGALDATFTPSGQGFDGAVSALLVTGGALYVGGAFSSYRGVAASANSLAKLNLATGAIDTTFSPPGVGSNGFDPTTGRFGGPARVFGLATAGTSLYVGGAFTKYRGVPDSAHFLAKLDLATGAIDTAFSPPGATANGFDSAVSALAVSGATLYCAGTFGAYRGVPGQSYIAKLDLSAGTRDATFGPPNEVGDLDQPAASLLAAGSTLWVGGSFLAYAGEPVNHLVKLDDTTFAVDRTFSPLVNNGTDNAVDVIVTAGTSLYVAGNFHAYRGVADSAIGLAKLDLTTGDIDTVFSPPGAGNNGFDNRVDSLAIAGTSLYVGGSFTAYRTTGDAQLIAKLDLTTGALDTTFSPPGNNGFGPPSNHVQGLAVAGTSLYAAGSFHDYRGVTGAASGLAKLDLTTGALDTTFSPAGASNNGFDQVAYVLAVAGTSLYVGGAFSSYRGVADSAHAIAKLDLTTGAIDTTFSPVGPSSNGFQPGAFVLTLAPTSTALYVGGGFTDYRGVTDAADHLAKLDLATGVLDTTFSPPGAGNNGFDGTVLTIGLAGSAAFVGGDYGFYRGTTDQALFEARLDATTGVRQ